MFIKYTVMALSLISIVACTHVPSTGEKMIAHSESTKQLGDEWRKGEKSVANAAKINKNGDKLIANGHKNIDKGNKLVAKGEQQLSSGKLFIKQAKNQTQVGRALQTKSEEKFEEKISQ